MIWRDDRDISWRAISRQLKSGRLEAWLRLAVLAAHPDDETLGASLVLARCSSPLVIYLTDGAPRDRALWSPDAGGTRRDYARLRALEAERALVQVNVASQRITWLGGVDQEAIIQAPALVNKLTQVLHRHQVDLVITHPYEGGHPDHDAAALIAHLARAKLPKNFLLMEMTSYHARSERCQTGVFLDSDPSSEIVFHLSDPDLARKSRMVQEHASQRRVLAGFDLRNERLRIAPEYDFSRPPHAGRLWYECMGWAMTGEQWRALARTAAAKTQENNAAHRA